MRTKDILLIEDNDVDIVSIKGILEDEKHNLKITVINDGANALDFIINKIERKLEYWPSLILLDYNLPLKNGDLILRYLKEKPRIKNIPVVVISHSKLDEHISKSYKFHANSYISKEIDIDVFDEKLVKTIEYWLEIVELPKPNYPNKLVAS